MLTVMVHNLKNLYLAPHENIPKEFHPEETSSDTHKGIYIVPFFIQ